MLLRSHYLTVLMAFLILGQVEGHNISAVFPVLTCFLIQHAFLKSIGYCCFWQWCCSIHMCSLCHVEYRTLFRVLYLWLNRFAVFPQHASLGLCVFYKQLLFARCLL